MSPLDRLITVSTTHRGWVLGVILLLMVAAGWQAAHLRFDAFPDLTNVQVQVLTTAPGLGAEEAELLLTRPIERALSGLPGLTDLRSVTRPGVSAVSVIFEDGTDLWHARALVKERVDGAREEIPEGAGAPQLAPPTTGLGEVVQFTIGSDDLSPAALQRIFQRDVVPRLRSVPGVVEVNAWGPGAPQLDVWLDPWAAAAVGLRWEEVHEALSASIGLQPGGDRSGEQERATVRALANPTTPDEVAAIVLRDGDPPLRVADVAEVREGSALSVGLGTADGEGEVVFVMVQLLAGADARAVVAGVSERLDEIRPSLPASVRIEPLYDREKLVGATLSTVTRSLVEGGLLVIFVLLLLLGDLRAGVLVASVIPMSMLGAFAGLSLLGMSGNLMSLGAIDFGLVVDGTVVVVESIVALHLPRAAPLAPAIAERARAVSRPVLAAVGLLLLVYLPVLAMTGTEGKLFRPMAVTVLLALGTALLLTFTWVPAVATFLVQPRGEHQTRLLAFLHARYTPWLDRAMRHPARAGGIAAVAVLGTGALGAGLGVEFVPRLEEGDLVLQTARLPNLSLDAARREATRLEAVVRRFPEVERVATRVGSPAVATDPMGLEEGDVLIRLKPRDQWTTADTTEGLVSAMVEAIEHDAPGAGLNATQPIEMRFNELLEGITSDVGVELYGEDMDALLAFGQQVAGALADLAGAADVKAPSVEGMPGLDLQVDADRLLPHHATATDALGLVAGVQRGTEVGRVLRGGWRDPVVLKTVMPHEVDLVDLPVVNTLGEAVTLGDLGELRTTSTPAAIRRKAGTRRVIVQANVRGRDLGSFVTEAQRVVSKLTPPPGVWVSWSGKYEQLQRAATRTAITVPLVLIAMLGILRQSFGAWRPAWLIFLNVPAAASGGVVALLLRGMPISMSAVVGFIALFGVAVMNGVVLVARIRELHAETADAVVAAAQAARERFRPVLMTAMVAGIGFLPMAWSHGVGAEVQRPLATVVMGGLVTATVLTLLVLPSLYARFVQEPPAGPT